MSTQTVCKVRAVVVDGKRVAMIRGSAKHVLQLPGGSVHPGESLADAIRREVYEETGCRVRIVRQAPPVRTRRSADLVEITTCFHVEVIKKGRRTALTGRERRRGLHVVWFANAKAAQDELRKVGKRYRRTAVRRDLVLTKTIARPNDPAKAIAKSARRLAACDGTTKTPSDLNDLLQHMRILVVACAALTGAGVGEMDAALKHGPKAGRKAVTKQHNDTIVALRNCAALIEQATREFTVKYAQ